MYKKSFFFSLLFLNGNFLNQTVSLFLFKMSTQTVEGNKEGKKIIFHSWNETQTTVPLFWYEKQEVFIKLVWFSSCLFSGSHVVSGDYSFIHSFIE